MSDGYLVVKCRKCAGKSGGRVAVHQDHVGVQLFDRCIHAEQALAGDRGESLPGRHDVQIAIRLERKNLHHAVKHLAMLRRHTAQALDLLARGKLLDQRCHFDRLRPRTEYAHDAQLFHHRSPPFFSASSILTTSFTWTVCSPSAALGLSIG